MEALTVAVCVLAFSLTLVGGGSFFYARALRAKLHRAEKAGRPDSPTRTPMEYTKAVAFETYPALPFIAVQNSATPARLAAAVASPSAAMSPAARRIPLATNAETGSPIEAQAYTPAKSRTSEAAAAAATPGPPAAPTPSATPLHQVPRSTLYASLEASLKSLITPKASKLRTSTCERPDAEQEPPAPPLALAPLPAPIKSPAPVEPPPTSCRPAPRGRSVGRQAPNYTTVSSPPWHKESVEASVELHRSGQALLEGLTRFYARYNPDKLPSVQGVVKSFVERGGGATELRRINEELAAVYGEGMDAQPHGQQHAPAPASPPPTAIAPAQAPPQAQRTPFRSAPSVHSMVVFQDACPQPSTGNATSNAHAPQAAPTPPMRTGLTAVAQRLSTVSSTQTPHTSWRPALGSFEADETAAPQGSGHPANPSTATQGAPHSPWLPQRSLSAPSSMGLSLVGTPGGNGGTRAGASLDDELAECLANAQRRLASLSVGHPQLISASPWLPAHNAHPANEAPPPTTTPVALRFAADKSSWLPSPGWKGHSPAQHPPPFPFTSNVAADACVPSLHGSRYQSASSLHGSLHGSQQGGFPSSGGGAGAGLYKSLISLAPTHSEGGGLTLFRSSSSASAAAPSQSSAPQPAGGGTPKEAKSLAGILSSVSHDSARRALPSLPNLQVALASLSSAAHAPPERAARPFADGAGGSQDAGASSGVRGGAELQEQGAQQSRIRVLNEYQGCAFKESGGRLLAVPNRSPMSTKASSEQGRPLGAQGSDALGESGGTRLPFSWLSARTASSSPSRAGGGWNGGGGGREQTTPEHAREQADSHVSPIDVGAAASPFDMERLRTEDLWQPLASLQIRGASAPRQALGMMGDSGRSMELYSSRASDAERVRQRVGELSASSKSGRRAFGTPLDGNLPRSSDIGAGKPEVKSRGASAGEVWALGTRIDETKKRILSDGNNSTRQSLLLPSMR